MYDSVVNSCWNGLEKVLFVTNHATQAPQLNDLQFPFSAVKERLIFI